MQTAEVRYKSYRGINQSTWFDQPTLTSLCVNGKGYVTVGISWGYQHLRGSLHRIVAETSIPNPEQLPTINHKDGNKMNNTRGNLEWMSYKDNQRHANETGLNNNIRKVTNKYNEVFNSTAEAAAAYGINRKTVYNECSGKHIGRAKLEWRWL